MSAIAQELKRIAVEGADIALGYYRGAKLRSWLKDGRSVVSEADHAVQAHLCARLAAAFPGAALLAEEAGAGPIAGDMAEAEHLFTIDPIDGTSSFVAGLPGWCVTIGYLHRGVPEAGAIFSPVWDDFYLVEDGADGRAFYNGVELPPLTDPGPVDGFTSVVCDSRILSLLKTPFPGKIRSYGSSALHLALAARSTVGFAQSKPVHIWDLAAPMALAAKVGMAVQYVDGAPVVLKDLMPGTRAKRSIVAGHPDRLPEFRSYFSY